MTLRCVAGENIIRRYRDYWDIVGALWDAIDIYEGPEVFRQTYNSVPREAGLMFAVHFCQEDTPVATCTISAAATNDPEDKSCMKPIIRTTSSSGDEARWDGRPVSGGMLYAPKLSRRSKRKR